MSRIHFFCTLALVLIAGCGRPGGSAALRKASGNEFGSAGYGCADTVAVARAKGVDYRKLVDRCLARDRAAMSRFFRLTKHAGFDAASAQGHAAVAEHLLNKLGDGFFGGCLARENAAVQAEVRDYLLYALGYGNTDLTLKTLGGKYPRTFPASVVKKLREGEK